MAWSDSGWQVVARIETASHVVSAPDHLPKEWVLNPRSREPVYELLAHSDSVRRLARRLTEDEHTAEDLVQEVWLAALESNPGERRDLGRWLHAVIRHAAARYYRRRSARERREAAAAAPERVTSLYDEIEGVSGELVDAVGQLPEPYRTVIALRFFDGLGAEAIARKLQRPVGTVKSQVGRGLVRLRRGLDLGRFDEVLR